MKGNFQQVSLKELLTMKACSWLCHIAVQLIIMLALHILIIIFRTLEINLGTGHVCKDKNSFLHSYKEEK